MKTIQYCLPFLLPRASLKALIIFCAVWFAICKPRNGRSWYVRIDSDFKRVSLSLHHPLLPLGSQQETVTSIDSLYVELRMPIGLDFPLIMALECLSHTQENMRNLELDPGLPQWEHLRSMEEVTGRKGWPDSWVQSLLQTSEHRRVPNEGDWTMNSFNPHRVQEEMTLCSLSFRCGGSPLWMLNHLLASEWQSLGPNYICLGPDTQLFNHCWPLLTLETIVMSGLNFKHKANPGRLWWIKAQVWIPCQQPSHCF